MTSFVTPIVEGNSETKAMERLLQRVWGEVLTAPRRLQVLEVFRGKRDQLLKEDGTILRETIEKAFLKLHARVRRDPTASGLVLVLLDAEKSLPCELAPAVVGRFQPFAPETRVAVSCVLANRMFENWIIAGCQPLAGQFGFPATLNPPDDPDSVGGKAWIKDRLWDVDPARAYSETADALPFVEGMDVTAARGCSRSFQKLCKELGRLIPTPPEEPSPSAPPGV